MATDLFQRILDEYGDAVWRVAAGYAAGEDDREDLYQDILVALWKAAARFRGESSLRTWVYRIAHNRGLSHQAYERRRRHLPLDEVDLPASTRPDPLARAEGAASRERLARAVRGLTPALRQPLILRLEGLDNREIAEILDLRPGTVAVRLTRARDALRPLLTDEAS